MIEIQRRLETLFERHRLIFWYDEDAALKEQFENIDITGVEKLLIDGNEFAIKRRVLKLQPKTKFLIYSPSDAPPDEENWLLDLNLANYIFSADKYSLILQNLGLDVSFKEFVTRYERFFRAAKRVEALRAMQQEREDTESLGRKMLAVAVGARNPGVESVLLRLMEKEERFGELERLGLTPLLFEALERKFGYRGESLRDLTHKLLLTHFYHAFDRSRAPLDSEAQLFVASWMDSSRYGESYRRIAKETEEELNIKTLLESMKPEALAGCDTFELCERALIGHLLQRFEREDSDAEETERLIRQREHSFWYEAYANLYRAILFAGKLFAFLRESHLEIESFEDGLERYASHWYLADHYYRKYTYHAARAEHLDLLKPLSQKVEELYLEGYLRPLGELWQPYAENYTTKTLCLPHQQRFYAEFVEVPLRKGQKLFVVISDALRYECGEELASRITAMDRYSVRCEAMVASLPSYTQLGMASLLPHETLSIGEKNDTVHVDGMSSAGTAKREKILRQHLENARAIGYEAFLKFSRDGGRAFMKESSLVYIYHDEIDKTGEKNESKTFDAVESTLETVVKIVRQISNFNGSNILLTSDHGFLYTRRPTEESEFCRVDAPEAIRLNRRFIIGRELEETACVAKYTPEALGIESENEFLVAKSINKIRLQGGGNRFVHGGAMPQELVIPLLSVKKRRTSDLREVNVELLPIHTVSTNSVNVRLYQSDIADEKSRPVTLRIGFESLDGVPLSDTVTHTFDSSERYDTNRESRFRLTLRKDIDAYNNRTIRLVARKVLPQSGERPLYKQLDVKLALSIFNDFDDDF
jgi:uncharacterized protein (TIGR02687 family)